METANRKAVPSPPAAWRPRALEVRLFDGRSLHLERDDAGAWTQDGRPAPHLAGATDVEAVVERPAPWGAHRQGGFTDPFGHRWSVGDHSPLGPQP